MKRMLFPGFLQVRIKELLLLVLLLAIACSLLFYKSIRQDNAFQDLAEENRRLSTRLEALGTQVANSQPGVSQGELEASLSQFRDELNHDIRMDGLQEKLEMGRLRSEMDSEQLFSFPFDMVTLDVLNQTGFRMIQNNNGAFYVGVQNVEPYLKGYQFSLVIGNPQTCSYGKGTATCYWAPEGLDEALTAGERRNAILRGSSFPIELSGVVRAGRWNTFTCYVPGVTEADLGSLSIALDLDGISF